MKTFELEDFLFHYVNEHGVSVMCMTDKKFQKKQSFAFLQDVKASLLEYYTGRDLQNAQQNSLGTFAETIREKIVSSLLLTRRLGILEFESGWVHGQDGPARELAEVA